ncbi:MAG: carbon-nitrogen hydrolase family protein [Pseudomonadota bacterium]
MRLAIWQAPSPEGDAEKGLADLAQAAETAASDGADLLVAPEVGLTGYAIGPEKTAALAEPQGGLYHRAVAEMARAFNLAICFGYPERTEAGVRNSTALIGADGQTALDYAKTHLWGDLDRSQYVAGQVLSPVVEILGWRVGAAICYDIEFPEVARALAIAGADLVLVPTASHAPFLSSPMRLVPARSEENGLFIAYANYGGVEGEGIYCGHSGVTAPDGTTLARAGILPELIMAELDLAQVAARRAQIPYLADRRPELYA